MRVPIREIEARQVEQSQQQPGLRKWCFAMARLYESIVIFIFSWNNLSNQREMKLSPFKKNGEQIEATWPKSARKKVMVMRLVSMHRSSGAGRYNHNFI